jgi:kynurenine formamidase
LAKKPPNRQTSRIETYYNHAEALEFVDECERDGVRILGMDFMSLDDSGGITPRNSTAWDDDLAPAESWREARLLLRDGVPDGGNVVVFVSDVP